MRDRLIAAFVGLTVAVIALYGVPRAFYLADLIRAQQVESAEHTADSSAAAVAAVLEDGESVTDDVLAGSLRDGQRVQYAAADGATRTVPASVAWADGDLRVTRTVVGGGRITVSVDDAVVAGEVRAALLPLVVLGVALVPVAALAGLLLARRLSRPFVELAGIAGTFGTGRLTIDVPHYAIPEAEAIGRALEDSTHRLDTLLRREREVAVHASHQLRTPITALRLTLEDLALWPQTAPEVADELHRIVGEVDRFSDAVTALLVESRSGRVADSERLDLGALVADAVDRWRPVAEGMGLSMGFRPSAGTEVELPRAPVVQAVDLLLQHACEVGSSTIEVACADRASHVAVEVAFAQRQADWHGPAAAGARREAGELAASLGGHLLQEPPPEDSVDVVLVLLLPSVDGARSLV